MYLWTSHCRSDASSHSITLSLLLLLLLVVVVMLRPWLRGAQMQWHRVHRRWQLMMLVVPLAMFRRRRGPCRQPVRRWQWNILSARDGARPPPDAVDRQSRRNVDRRRFPAAAGPQPDIFFGGCDVRWRTMRHQMWWVVPVNRIIVIVIIVAVVPLYMSPWLTLASSNSIRSLDAWHSDRTLVFDRRTFPVLCSTYS